MSELYPRPWGLGEATAKPKLIGVKDSYSYKQKLIQLPTRAITHPRVCGATWWVALNSYLHQWREGALILSPLTKTA